MYFAYGNQEISALKMQDPKLGAVIDKFGYIKRQVDPDLFTSVVFHIIGQQISTKAQATIFKRLQDSVHKINADNLLKTNISTLHSCGITKRKAQYILAFAHKVQNQEFHLEKIDALSDEEAIKELVKLDGVGVWTAQMILLFCLQRPNIFSFSDLALKRGLCIIYQHQNIDRQLFEQYRQRFSPYGSIASFYLWAVANNASK